MPRVQSRQPATLALRSAHSTARPMTTLTHSLSITSDLGSLAPSRDLTAPTSWFARLKKRFVIDFDTLDELDLGTPEEFDAYVCGLFERDGVRAS